MYKDLIKRLKAPICNTYMSSAAQAGDDALNIANKERHEAAVALEACIDELMFRQFLRSQAPRNYRQKQMMKGN